MDDLELSLQFLHLLVETFELRVAYEVGRDIEGDQKLGEIGSLLERGGVLEEEVVDGVDDFSIAVEQSSFPLGCEFAVIGEDPEELCDLEDDFLGLGLPGVDVDVWVEVLEDLEDEVAEIEGAHFVQSHQGDVLLEGRLVQQQHDLLYLLGLDRLLLNEGQRSGLGLHDLNYLKVKP